MKPHPLSDYACPTCCERITDALDEAGYRSVRAGCPTTGLALTLTRVSETHVAIYTEPLMDGGASASPTLQ